MIPFALFILREEKFLVALVIRYHDTIIDQDADEGDLSVDYDQSEDQGSSSR